MSQRARHRLAADRARESVVEESPWRSVTSWPASTVSPLIVPAMSRARKSPWCVPSSRLPFCCRCSVWVLVPAAYRMSTCHRPESRPGCTAGSGRVSVCLADSISTIRCGDDLLVARRHHRRCDRDARIAPASGVRRPRPPPPPPPSAMRGSVLSRDLDDLGAREPELLRIPPDRDARAAVAQAGAGLALHDGGHAGDLRRRDRAMCSHRADPLLPLGGVIALDPALDRDEHADHLFAADLHGARVAVMRRAVDPRGLHEILAAEQQPRALRPADELAAAVADQRRAALQVDVRNGENLGRGVHQHRHVVRLGDRGRWLRSTSGPYRRAVPRRCRSSRSSDRSPAAAPRACRPRRS